MKVRCTNCMKEFDENKIIYSEEEKEMKEISRYTLKDKR